MTTESAPTEVIVVVAAVIEDGDRFLLTRRQAGVHLEGFWEFPGGKVDVGETHEAALIREMREELDVDVTVGAQVFAAVHRYPDRRVALHFLRCGLNGEPRPMLGQAMAWVERDELRTLRFPEADAELIARLTSRAL
ncbi:MAG: (deoxy)nucleoside triphosphate pyrophosphohydrolase [Vicinamibacterales bacterium]